MTINRLPPEFIKIIQKDFSLTGEYRRFFEKIVYDLEKLGNTTIPDSTATTVVDLRDDFNTLLAALRQAGVIS